MVTHIFISFISSRSFPFAFFLFPLPSFQLSCKNFSVPLLFILLEILPSFLSLTRIVAAKSCPCKFPLPIPPSRAYGFRQNNYNCRHRIIYMSMSVIHCLVWRVNIVSLNPLDHALQNRTRADFSTDMPVQEVHKRQVGVVQMSQY